MGYDHSPIEHAHTEGPYTERRSIFPAGNLASRIAGRKHVFDLIGSAQRAGYRKPSFDNVATVQLAFANASRPINPVVSSVGNAENYGQLTIAIHNQQTS